MPGYTKLAARMLMSLALFCSCTAAGQDRTREAPVDRSSEASVDRPRVGVALSGGGVKGFAHVGALRVILAAGLPIDVVAGTSMGSFVGGLYAVGYPIEQIDSLLYVINWRELFEDGSPRRQQPLEYRYEREGLLLSLPLREGRVELPRGLVSGQRISQTLSRLFFPAWDVRDFRQLPVPFGAVAADLSDGEAVLLTSGHLPEAIRASTSIPSVFDPIVVDGRTLIDGGVSRNLPAQDARSLGADAVICVDVGRPVLPVDSLETLVDVMLQAVGFRMLESTLRQRTHCDVLVTPEVDGVETFDFDRTGELVDRGEEGALQVLDELEALRDSLFGDPHFLSLRRPSLLTRPDTVLVNDIQIEGASRTNEAVVRRAMGLSLPAFLSKSELDNAVDRAYDTQRFARVTYRIDPASGGASDMSGATLVVRVVEGKGDRVAVGLRYDSDYRAAILARVTLSDLLGDNSRLVASLRLGEIVQLGARLATPMGFGPRLRLFMDAQVSRTPIDLFEAGRRTSNLAANVAEVGLQAGTLLRPGLGVSAGVRGELFDIDPRIVAGDGGVSFDFLDERNGLVFGEAQLRLDTFDRVSFPRSGARVTARSAMSVGPLSSDTFGQHLVDASARVPVSSSMSLSGRLVAGRTYGSSTPVHYLFFAGGAFPADILSGRQFPLFGHKLQEVAGLNMRAIGVGAQLEVHKNAFAGADFNAAAASAEWSWDVDPDDFVGGAGVWAGFRTVVGPVLIVLTSGSFDGPYELHLSVGYFF